MYFKFDSSNDFMSVIDVKIFTQKENDRRKTLQKSCLQHKHENSVHNKQSLQGKERKTKNKYNLK